MRRSIFLLIAALGFLCAGNGIWLGGLRNEIDIERTLHKFSRPNDIPFYRCADSFYWVSYAREMIDSGHMRVRFTQMDNAPAGRPNLGWASLNAWYLVALAKVWSLATGMLPRDALLPASLWASPILYLLTLSAILGLGAGVKNFPAAAAAVLVLGTAPRIYDDFAYAVPGHHGWHDLACFATLVSLAAGIRKTNSRPWFIAAGLAGAIAFWIGVTQQAFGIAAAGAGALGGMLISRLAISAKATGSLEEAIDLPAAESWRIFGFTGAITSLVFYLVEYAPGPLAMRLEVNHPIYALGFLLGGEFLCRAQRLIFPRMPVRSSDRLVALASAAALAAIVSAIFFGRVEWHTMRQPFIQRLHHEIAEFQSIALAGGHDWVVILGLPIFLVGAAIYRALGRGRAARDRVALLVCAGPCAVAIGLSFLQLRWAGIAGASAAAVAAVLFAGLKEKRLGAAEGGADDSANRRAGRVPLLQAACVCLSLGLIAFWDMRRNDDNTGRVRAEIIDRLATMEVASVLQSHPQTANLIAVFSDQKERQAWINFGTGIRSVGSLYWDNPAGIRDEADFLATYSEEAAHQIARARGITYVVTTPKGGSVVAYHYMWQGNKTAPEIRQTLAYRLAAPKPAPPSWLRLLPTATPAMTREGIRVYRVL